MEATRQLLINDQTDPANKHWEKYPVENFAFGSSAGADMVFSFSIIFDIPTGKVMVDMTHDDVLKAIKRFCVDNRYDCRISDKETNILRVDINNK